MRKIILLCITSLSFLCTSAQTYSFQDVVNHIKTFNSHMLFLEGPRMLVGTYDTVELNGPYFKIVLEGELWAAGQHFGKLYQCISFDARNISNDVQVVPMVDPSSGTNRWDVVLKTKGDKLLIHFKNEQQTHVGGYFIRVHQDVEKINIMFVSKDAAERFKAIAKSVFR